MSLDTTSGDFRYPAFISYRHVEPDRRWARWLHGALESFRTPKPLVAAGVRPRIGRVFRDEDELPASADLSREIDLALEQSEYLIVVCSPRTPESRWVNQEILRFREMGRDDKIIALLVEGEPGDAFPVALREVRRTVVTEDGQTVENVEAIEPLAADVRTSRNEPVGYLKRNALLRVAASVLGCRFDDLRRREAERRKRRMLAISGGLVVLVAVLAGSLIYALKQRDDAIQARIVAERERKRANEQRDVADRERKRALDNLESAELVSKFLTDDLLGSVDPRTARGREITIREVLDDASQDVGTRFADRPAIEAAVRHTLGRVYLGIARYEEALAHAERALALYEELEGKQSLAVAHVLETMATLMTAGDLEAQKRGLGYSRRCADIREAILGKDDELTMRARMDSQMYEQLIEGLPPGVASEPVLKVFAALRGKGETVDQVRDEVMRLIALATRLWREGRKDELAEKAQQEAQMYLDNPLFAERVPPTWASFAQSLQRAGQPTAARALAFCAVEVAVRNFTEAHPSALFAIAATANILYEQGKLKECEQWYARHVALMRKTVGDDHAHALDALEQHIVLLAQLGRRAEAEKKGLELYERRKRVNGVDHQRTRDVAAFLAELYTHLERSDEAARWRKAAAAK